MEQTSRTDRRAMVDNRDPRAERTRRKLVGAFHEAVADEDPARMSVSSLTRAAGVNRTSFYMHFDSPEDLALHALRERFDEVGLADIALRADGSSSRDASRAAIGAVVGFVSERPAVYRRLLGPGASPRFAQALKDRFALDTARALREMPNLPDGVDVDVVARFLAGGVLDTIGDWLARDDASSPEHLVEEIVRCLPGWLVDD